MKEEEKLREQKRELARVELLLSEVRDNGKMSRFRSALESRRSTLRHEIEKGEARCTGLKNSG